MTVRFHSEVRNGSIVIPSELRSQLGDNTAVDVEVRTEVSSTDHVSVENYIDYLLRHPLKVKNSITWLNRDEIYDRRN